MTELVSGMPAPQFGGESSWVRGSELVQGSSVSFWLMQDDFAYPPGVRVSQVEDQWSRERRIERRSSKIWNWFARTLRRAQEKRLSRRRSGTARYMKKCSGCSPEDGPRCVHMCRSKSRSGHRHVTTAFGAKSEPQPERFRSLRGLTTRQLQQHFRGTMLQAAGSWDLFPIRSRRVKT
jgi:hypothetical protein